MLNIMLTNSPGEYSIQLAREFTKMGHTVTLIPSLKHASPLLCKFIKNADSIHINSACQGFGALIANKFFGIPYVLTIHGTGMRDSLKYGLAGTVDPYRIVEDKLTSLVAKNAHTTISISRFAGTRLMRNYGIKTHMIYHGVDLNKFNPSISGECVREKLGIGNDPMVLFVGRFIPTKDPFTFLKAIPKILCKNPKVKFVMLGEGILKKNIAKIVKSSSQLRDHVIFPGFVDRIEEYYAAADVFVFTSIWEGFGYVLTEAMACGTPVVASDQGSPPEIIGGVGLLFRTGNPNDLATKVITVLSNKELSQRMRRDGVRRVKEKFRWDICAKQVLEIYKSAINSQRTR